MTVRLLFCLLLLIAGCSKKPDSPLTEKSQASSTIAPAPEVDQRVSGQVFIVTESSQNIPLALVDVKLYPAETIGAFIDSKASSAEEIRKQLKERYEKLSTAVSETEARRPVGIEKADRLLQEMENLNAQDSRRAARTLEDSGIVSDFKKQLKFETNLRDEYGDDYAAWPTSDFYFSEVPPPLTTVKTDMNGRFVLKCNRLTRYVVLASSTRRVGDRTEEYYWMVKVPTPNAEGTQILLSNHNLTTSQSSDSVVECKRNHIVHSLQEFYYGSGMLGMPNR